jgi:hypothetical protein
VCGEEGAGVEESADVDGEGEGVQREGARSAECLHIFRSLDNFHSLSCSSDEIRACTSRVHANSLAAYWFWAVTSSRLGNIFASDVL